jgi:hypothetical protein
MTDIDGQLLTLGRVAPTAAPPRAVFEAIVERNRAQRTRARRAAAGVAAVVVAGTGAFLVRTLDDGRSDVAANVGADPNANSPDAATGGNDNDIAGSDVGGEDENCDLAGPETAGELQPDDLADVGGALEARFPSCFGGIVRTGPSSADLYVVDEFPGVKEAAQQMLGPGFTLTVLPSARALVDIEALKSKIDEDAGQLHAAGISTYGTGIRIESDGPKVLLGISPYSSAAVDQIEELYGADSLIIQDFGAVIPG